MTKTREKIFGFLVMRNVRTAVTDIPVFACVVS